MRRWRERYEEFSYDGLFDRRQGKPSPKRVPVALVEQGLGLYRDRYSANSGSPPSASQKSWHSCRRNIGICSSVNVGNFGWTLVWIVG